jgi:hypothetical protein
MAAALNVGLGHYIHLSDSLHIYDNSDHTKNILNSDYEFDVYDFCDPYVLTYKEILDFNTSRGRPDINCNSFLILADEVISESNNFRKTGYEITDTFKDNHFYKYQYCGTNYAKACANYLFAYDLFKRKSYDKALQLIISTSELGFTDFAICGLEFFCRKQEFLSHCLSDIEKFINSNFNNNDSKRILHYILNH